MGSLGSDTSSGIRHIVGVIRRWWLLMLLCITFTLGVASLAIVSSGESFIARSEILISQPTLANRPEVGNETVVKLNDLMPTFALVAESDSVLSAVRTATSSNDSLNGLRADIVVRRMPETLVLAVEVRRTSAQEAGDIAAALVDQFTTRVDAISSGGERSTDQIVATTLRAPDVEEIPRNTARTLVVAFVLGFGLAAIAAFALDRA